jgi:hypothetical protein
VLRELARSFRGDRAGVARAAAIVVGLGVTTAGYVVGLLSPRPTPYAKTGPAGSTEP